MLFTFLDLQFVPYFGCDILLGVCRWISLVTVHVTLAELAFLRKLREGSNLPHLILYLASNLAPPTYPILGVPLHTVRPLVSTLDLPFFHRIPCEDLEAMISSTIPYHCHLLFLTSTLRRTFSKPLTSTSLSIKIFYGQKMPKLLFKHWHEWI